MNIEDSHFKDILLSQINARSKYDRHPYKNHNYILGVSIKDNRIESYSTINPLKLRTEGICKLINDCLQKYVIKDMQANFCLNDFPVKNVINICRPINDTNYFLYPFTFSQSALRLGSNIDQKNNFDQYTSSIRKADIPINEKIDKIYFNGMPKQRLKFFEYATENIDICDAHLYHGPPHHFFGINDAVARKLAKTHIAKKTITPWVEHLKYKYALVTNGNHEIITDRLKVLMASNDIIIKEKCKYEEFFHYKLKDKENYMEIVQPEEIRSTMELLSGDVDLCNKLRENNKKFVDEQLNYEQVLLYTSLLLNGLV